jgi:hypothetical protein
LGRMVDRLIGLVVILVVALLSVFVVGALVTLVWDHPQLVVCEFGKPLAPWEVDLNSAKPGAELVPHEVGPCTTYDYNTQGVD